MNRSWAARLVLVATLAFGTIEVSTAAAKAAPEPNDRLQYAVKATFIYKLAAFIEWPNSAFQSSTSPINLCVAGPDPFGKTLEQATAGQRIDARTIAIRRVGAFDRATGCHILYVAAPDAPSAARVLRGVRGTPVLTVTDAAFEDSTKGIIHFVLRDNRVRFEIDAGAAAQNGVTVSSKLQSLAVPARSNS